MENLHFKIQTAPRTEVDTGPPYPSASMSSSTQRRDGWLREDDCGRDGRFVSIIALRGNH
jgi:hypothetical protein